MSKNSNVTSTAGWCCVEGDQVAGVDIGQQVTVAVDRGGDAAMAEATLDGGQRASGSYARRCVWRRSLMRRPCSSALTRAGCHTRVMKFLVP